MRQIYQRPNTPKRPRVQVERTDPRGLEFSFIISVLLMPNVAPLVTEAQAASLDASSQSRRFRGGLPGGRTLVATGYGRRDWFLRRLLVVSDAACLAVAMTLALVLAGGSRGHSWQELLLCGLITLPAWVVLFKLYGLYERDAKRLSHSTLDDLPSLFHVLLLGSLLTWCWFVVVAPAKLVFTAVLVFAALAMMLVLAGRVFTRAGFVRLVSPERVLLIGTGPASRALMQKMRANASLRLEAIGMVNCQEDAGDAMVLPRLGNLDEVDLPGLLAEQRVGRVVVADAEVEGERLLGVLRDCKTASVKVSLLPATCSALGPSVEVDDLQGLTLLGINPSVLSRSSRVAKRGLDIAGASLLTLLALPLLAALAVAIKLDSRGPVFFHQERIGRGGNRFRLLKLRTMVLDAETRRAELFAQSKEPGWLHLDHDPRITRVGRLLRLTSLDELPQLWNVLKGDMSLVGPRPLVAEEDRMVDDWARGRLDLTPGITGLWQVLGRTSIPFEEMVKLDYLYVTNWSLWGDVRLILRTLPVVLRRSGAN
jgi:exopolysaccharide biosynthesis polyprenyl glycosylphosphotransferase